jgi:hypothetical protein
MTSFWKLLTSEKSGVRHNVEYPDEGFSWFFLVPLGKCLDTILN